jgi:hypothetical protein
MSEFAKGLEQGKPQLRRYSEELMASLPFLSNSQDQEVYASENQNDGGNLNLRGGGGSSDGS